MQRYIFDKIWFKEHQKILIWLLNAPAIKYWFRWVLRINKDCKYTDKICKLAPNSYTIYLGMFLTKEGLRYKFKQDFRTHNKFSKRLYHAFYPMWCLFHIWDLFADHYSPQLSFGFSTLTVYPNAGASSPCDGSVAITGGSYSLWSQLRDGTANTTQTNTAQDYFARIRCNNDPGYNSLYRSIFNFDTSSLGSGATITSVVASLYGVGKANDFSGTASSYNFFSVSPAATNTIGTGDYGNFGSTAYATAISYSGWSTSAYNEFTFNTTGKSAISKTGITSLGFRESIYDAPNSAITKEGNKENNVQGYFADQSGTSYDPKLVIEYTLPATFTGSETINLSDNMTILRARISAISDTINASEVMTALRARISAISDTINASEVMTALRGYSLTFVENITTAGSIIVARTWAFAYSETINLTENIKNDITATIQDIVNISEVITNLRARLFSAVESINISETMTALRARISAISDSINTSEVMTAYREIISVLSEEVDVSDAMTAVKGIVISISDTIQISSSFIFNWLKIAVKPIINTIKSIKPRLNKIDDNFKPKIK